MTKARNPKTTFVFVAIAALSACLSVALGLSGVGVLWALSAAPISYLIGVAVAAPFLKKLELPVQAERYLAALAFEYGSGRRVPLVDVDVHGYGHVAGEPLYVGIKATKQGLDIGLYYTLPSFKRSFRIPWEDISMLDTGHDGLTLQFENLPPGSIGISDCEVGVLRRYAPARLLANT